MSLTTSQFEALLFQTVKKLKSIEGVESYILDTPCVFALDWNGKPDKLHYNPDGKGVIDLEWLFENGGAIPSNNYEAFISQLLQDAKEVIEASNEQRKMFANFLEQIEKL